MLRLNSTLTRLTGSVRNPSWAQSMRAPFSDAKKKRAEKKAAAVEERKKKKAAAARVPEQRDTDQATKNLKIMLAALDAKEKKEPPISDEEKARRYQVGRNYVIGRFQQSNLVDHDLSCKIKMKEHAIRMLPRKSKLLEAAMEENEEGPPRSRNIPVWTPPIPGFDASKYTMIEEEEK